MSEARGDAFALARHLDQALDFAAARQLLRSISGLAPAISAAPIADRRPRDPMPVARRWDRRPALSMGSPVWRYLAGTRRLPDFILEAAHAVDAVREGPHGSAWFAHRDVAGNLTGIEMRGPVWRAFSAGGVKTLFGLSGQPVARSGILLPRLAVCEAAIDALSLAAIEQLRPDTLYAATTGGMGPATVAQLRLMLPAVAVVTGGILIAATDADPAGERQAARLEALASEFGAPFARLPPPHDLKDWNDALRHAGP